MTIIRYPFPAELDAHEASLIAEEGELIARHRLLDNLANPAGEPLPALPPHRYGLAFLGLVLIVIDVVVWASAGYFLR